ncbi:MAG TPA: hypothetical protein VMC06_08225 [Opitutaceae bacterium]|nr:hypothetical protein [Opitutaceae bacterium]
MRFSAGVNAIVGQTMKVGLIVTATIALAPFVRAEENDIPRPVHVVSELAQKAFPYDPAAVQKKEATKEKEPDEKVVTMERFTVLESRRSLELERKIESENAKIQSEKFTIVRGGTILKKDIGRTRVELGAWSTLGGLNFLKCSW